MRSFTFVYLQKKENKLGKVNQSYIGEGKNVGSVKSEDLMFRSFMSLCDVIS